MDWNQEAFVQTLKNFNFDKNQAHRWLLAKREKREAILRENDLLDVLQDLDAPFLIGNLITTQEKYEWGQVRFESKVGDLDSNLPCSIYAAFEHFIRRCNIFPLYISLADIQRCSDEGVNALPVYGSAFSLQSIPRARRQSVISKMLNLHGILRRPELLVDQIAEVTDSELFALFFEQTERLDAGAKTRAAKDDDDDDDDGSALDNIIVRHS